MTEIYTSTLTTPIIDEISITKTHDISTKPKRQ